MTSTRERILQAATELYAQQGVRATTNAHVQAAVGLAPGSGALYKHFASKTALLEAVVDAYADRLAVQGEEALVDIPDGVEAALGVIADAVERATRSDAAALRIVLRELDDRPDLVDRTWRAVTQRIYGAFAGWARAQATAGRLGCAEPEERATVLMAALTLPWLTEALFGETPEFGLDRSYRDAWVATALVALEASPTASTARAAAATASSSHSGKGSPATSARRTKP